MTAGNAPRFRSPPAADPDVRGEGPPPPRAAANPHVFVTIPTANFSHRQILEGVLEYARKCGPWLFHLSTGDIAAQGLRRRRRKEAERGPEEKKESWAVSPEER